MKQTLLMIALTFLGTAGILVVPMLSVGVYYLFAVLRPQNLWQWALPPDVEWSYYVALAACIAAGLQLCGITPVPTAATISAAANKRRSFGSAHVAIFLFAVWVTLSYYTAIDRNAAWAWFIEYLKIILMFFVSAILIQTLRHLWYLMIAAAVALGYIAYEINFMYLTTRYMGVYFNGYGGLDNNGAGLMLAMGVPLCLFIYLGTRQWWRWIFAALIPVLLHAVFLTFSRGAMLALCLAAPTVFFRGRHRAQLALAAVAIAVAVPWLAGNEIRQEFYSVDSYEEDGSAQSRFNSWGAAYRISLDYPVFGAGVRNSNLISMAYGADSEGRAIHSQFLQILADSGYPALIFYLLVFWFVAVSLRRVRRWARHDTTDDARIAYAVACAVEGSLVVFLIGGLFLSLDVFELPYMMILLGAQLPLVLGLERAAAPGVARSASPRPEPATVIRQPRVPRTSPSA